MKRRKLGIDRLIEPKKSKNIYRQYIQKFQKQLN